MKKRIVSLLLALAMLLCVSACSAEENEFLGTWKCYIDLADIFNSGMAEADETVAEYLEVSEFKLSLILELREDNSYTLRIDEAAFGETCDNVIAHLKEGMRTYLADILESQGSTMTVDEALQATGLQLEGLFEPILDEMIYELIDLYTQDGTYSTEDGIFTMTDSDGDETSDYYTLENGVLTLDLIDPAADEYEASLYPFVFNKIA